MPLHPNPGSKGSVTIHVDMGGSLKLPAHLKAAEELLLVQVAKELAELTGRLSGSARIAAATHVTSFVGQTANIVVGEGVPFTVIRDRGGVIRPRPERYAGAKKPAPMLRFADGSFRKFSRQTGRHFTDAAKEAFPGIVQWSYHNKFNRLQGNP